MMDLFLTVGDSTSAPRTASFAHDGAGYDMPGAAEGDGAAALAIAGRRAVSLVATEKNIPNLDGIARRCQPSAIPSCACAPLLMPATKSGSENERCGTTGGATALIVRPSNPQQRLNPFGKMPS